MSPARRRLLLLVGLAAGLVVLVVVVLQVTGRKAAVRPVSQSVPGPVLLIPGYGGTTAELQPLATKLRAAGRTVVVVNVPNGGTGDLRVAAKALGTAVDTALAGGGSSVDLVGYSAGGVIARLYVADGGGSKVRRVVTLGAPHHGTQVAALAQTFASSQCTVACQQLVPGSSLLAGLAETPAGPAWVSLWSSTDEVVTPPTSASLKGAVDLVLQDICPGIKVSHGDLPTTPLVEGIVLAELGTAPVSHVSGCAQLSS